MEYDNRDNELWIARRHAKLLEMYLSAYISDADYARLYYADFTDRQLISLVKHSKDKLSQMEYNRRFLLRPALSYINEQENLLMASFEGGDA